MFTERNSLDSSFLTKNNINNGLLTKQYSVSELREGLLRLSNMLTNGYWPKNKENLSKSLLVLLFNSETCTSMFLKVMNKKPEQLSKSRSRRPIDENEDMTESLLESNLRRFVLDEYAEQGAVPSLGGSFTTIEIIKTSTSKVLNLQSVAQ